MEEEMIDMMDQLEENPQKVVKCFLLKNHHWMISEIQELRVDYELNVPNCKLVKPYQIDEVYDYDEDWKVEWEERPLVKIGRTGYRTKHEIYPWKDLTNDDEILIFSDYIVTIVEPRPELLEAYLEATE